MASGQLIVLEGVAGLIFDCDGTLVDSLPVHYRAWVETFALFGLTCPTDFLLQHNGKPTEQIIALYNKAFRRTIDVGEFTAEKERRTYARLDQVTPLEPVAALARRYAGRLPMAVVSGSNRANVERALQAADLLALFPIVLTADDGLPPKPAPDLFLAAARRMEVDPSTCQVFEDADSGLEAARCAGMRAVDVRPILGALSFLPDRSTEEDRRDDETS